jgi:hypothetical protein
MNGYTRFSRIAPWFLLMVGLLQMTGDLFNISVLKGIGAATAASPAPKVFSAVKGLETYSTKFYLDWTDAQGKTHSLLITPEVYSRLKGPYNRRNVYGAALAYGPVLPNNLREPVVTYALCGKAPLLRELGLFASDVLGPMRIRMEPLPGTVLPDMQTTFEVSCP